MAAPTTVTHAPFGRLCFMGIISLLVLQFLGCISSPMPSRRGPEVVALRIRDIASEGDPQRRASTRLILDGLAADDPRYAVSHYERAIKTDATNPYAYLALAAYEIQWGDVERGEQSLNQADQMFRIEGSHSPRVDPHLDGLRGRAKIRRSDAPRAKADGMQELDRAKRTAPDVWGDGWLTSEELR